MYIFIHRCRYIYPYLYIYMNMYFFIHIFVSHSLKRLATQFSMQNDCRADTEIVLNIFFSKERGRKCDEK